MDFGEILTRAWQIIWKNRVLWLFGVLASCTSQGNYSGSFSGSGGGEFSGDFNNPAGEFQGKVPPAFENFARWIEGIPEETFILVAAAIVCLAIILSIVFYLISTYGRVTVIEGALQAERGMALTFRQLASDGAEYLWSALGLNLLLGLVVFLVGMAFALIAIVATVFTFGIGLLCLIPLACLFVPIGIAYSVYVELANVALVSDKLGVMDAIRRAWEVMRDNLGNIAVMALILVIGGGIISIIIGFPIALVFIPLVFGFVANNGEFLNTSLAVSGICLVLAIPVVIFLNGILRSYIISAWTLTYEELTGAEA